MCEVVEISDDEDFSVPEEYAGIMPKDESLDYELLPQNVSPKPWPGNEASTSTTNLRSSFIGMGFAPSVVDKAIEEQGDEDAELLLETIVASSALHKSKLSSSSDSLSSDDQNKDAFHAFRCRDFPLKKEPDVCNGISDEKMACLLKMNFSLDEVGFAFDRLGRDASVDQLMDFIFAARMAKKYETDANHPIPEDEETKKDCNNEALFRIMEKTLRLLEMGFSEQEISTAFDKCGTEVPLQELAESIVAGPISGSGPPSDKHPPSTSLSSSNTPSGFRSSYRKMGECSNSQHFDSVAVKPEEYSLDAAPQVEISELLEKLKGKRPKEEYMDARNNHKKPKEEFEEDSSMSVGRMRLESRGCSSSISNRAPPLEGRVGSMGFLNEVGNPKKPISSLSNNFTGMVAKPPYFFYGNVMDLSHDSWRKISQFLYSVDPEFVSTRLYSALSRKEGYVHNLPTKDRSHVLSKGPMTIEDAIPHAKKWWPSWDVRKHLSNINCETSGMSQLCDRLGRMLAESRGHLSGDQQRDILRQCQAFSLVWVGHFKLAQIEPEHLERIMGYPLHHSRVAGFSPSERLKLLKLSFQTDTLGYHLSGLKDLFKGGLKVLSFFSGIGGAEVALHRLGIHLNCVVSVEHSEIKRKILKQWWGNTGQRGELIQIENINKLSGNKLEQLMKKFDGFDIVMCQNPYTAADSDSLSGLDFSLFVEFVRVLQRVRQMMDRNR